MESIAESAEVSEVLNALSNYAAHEAPIAQSIATLEPSSSVASEALEILDFLPEDSPLKQQLLSGDFTQLEKPKRLSYSDSYDSLDEDNPNKRRKRYHKRENVWEEMYEQLRMYKHEHGHTNVPRRSGKLGMWVQSQRNTFSRGKMDSEHVAKLEDLGFIFSMKEKTNDEIWEDHFHQLKVFKNQHGHTNVPQTVGRLGSWVNNQRAKYKLGKLTEERIQKLEEIGFVWALKNEEAGKLQFFHRKIY